MEDEKIGITRIAYIENIHQHLSELDQKTDSFVKAVEFNEDIEQRLTTNDVECFDAQGNERDSTGSDISFFIIPTRYHNEDNEILYALFWRQTPGSLILDKSGQNIGVAYGTKDELVNLGKKKAAEIYLRNVYRFPRNSASLCTTFNDRTDNNFSTEEFMDLTCLSILDAQENGKETRLESPFGGTISMFPLIWHDSPLQCDNSPLFVTLEETPDEYRRSGPRFETHEELKYNLLLQNLQNKGFHTLGDFVFSSKNQAIAFLQNVADRAMIEDWEGPESTDGDVDDDYVLPVLRSYLIHMYHRLQHEDKVVLRNGKCYFNSGLLDRFFRQIFIVGDMKEYCIDLGKVLGSVKTNLPSNMRAYSENRREIANIFSSRTLPQSAEFFEGNLANVIFDAELDIRINDDHVFEDGLSRNRLPMYSESYQKVKDDEEKLYRLIQIVSANFEEALRRARMLARRNYKLAVPQYWNSKNKGEIQFLLPIYLDSIEQLLADGDIHRKPACALVLSLYRNGDHSYYRGETILTLRMAYKNARLLARPDAFWLTSSVL